MEKERTHYLNAIQRLREAGDEQAATALQAELDRVDAGIAQADYRAANIRAGYVYVVSKPRRVRRGSGQDRHDPAS